MQEYTLAGVSYRAYSNYLCIMDEERLKKIKASLDDVHEWPSVYMFKFIVPSDSDKFDQVVSLFSKDIELFTRKSRNGKYTSLTIQEVILNSDEVIARYKAASLIEGVVAL